MALQDAILVALASGESSGYDLAKSFNVTVANYWTATAQQLYRELDKMAAKGLVTARVVEQERRPNKRIFALTEAGRQALHDSTTRQPKPTAMRDELLVQVEAIDHGDASAIRAAVAAKRAASQTKLTHYQRRKATLLAGGDEAAYLRAGRRIGPYLTLARGIAFEEENIRWCDWMLAVTGDEGSVPAGE